MTHSASGPRKGHHALTRRDTLALGAGALAAAVAPPAHAQEGTELHGLSAFGDLKYPADFKHFDYVNPDAPKGGTFSQVAPVRQFNQNFLTFNTFNVLILKGDGAQGMDRTFATLMSPSSVFVGANHDEPDSCYAYAARSVRISADGLTYRYAMRPEAKFHDGTRLTAHDVAFTLMLLKDKGHPLIVQQLRDFAGAEATDDATLVARFVPGRGRDVPLFVAQLPILSRAYYSSRPFEESTLDIPLGSGPYKVARYDVGHFVEYERVKDWWGAELPVWRGLNNFDVLRFEYFREREAGFQAFTSKTYLFQEEFTSRFWATRYEFPAIKDGRVKRDETPDNTPSGAQGWFINTRIEKFKDARVREALGMAFDFEWTNKNIMYGSYKRTHSVFQNSDMMATGKPSAAEIAVLEPFRSRVPAEVFGEPYVPPVSDGSGQDRNLLRQATALLRSGNCTLRNGKLYTPKGEQLIIEFLIDDQTFQPHHLPFVKNLAVLGIDASVRILDPVQFRARQDSFEFDFMINRISFPLTPGDGLRTFFSSEAAATKGSQNLAGVADPVIDALIDKIIAANSREELNAACRALDRVYRAGRYWIPQWSKASHWIAFWDVFGRPATHQRYGRGIPDTWWYDRDKAAKIERAG